MMTVSVGQASLPDFNRPTNNVPDMAMLKNDKFKTFASNQSANYFTQHQNQLQQQMQMHHQHS